MAKRFGRLLRELEDGGSAGTARGATASEGDPPKEQTGQSKLQERGLTRKSGDRWRRGKATLQENIGGLLCQQTLKS